MEKIYFQKKFACSLGTYPLKGEQLLRTLETAVKIGYRAIDTAQMYENEEEVGEFLSGSRIPREEFLITTKVMPSNFPEKLFFSSVETCLKKLRLDKIDVLLLHWPPAGGDVDPSLKLLEEARKKGLAKEVGVSNYTSIMMKRAKELLENPVVNQVEFHPLLDQSRLLKASQEIGIPLSSYCSVARGKVFEEAPIAELAEKYGKSRGQIVLRWILQKGVSVNVMSTNPENLEKNFAIFDFSLEESDVKKIDLLNSKNFRIVDSQLVPWAPEWD